jgi:hypothetical protein
MELTWSQSKRTLKWLASGFILEYTVHELSRVSCFMQQELTSSLKLPHVAGLFYILLCGIGLAMLTATCEFLYKTKVEAGYRKVSLRRSYQTFLLC